MSAATNLISLAIMLFGLAVPGHAGELAFTTGLFAFSGGFTNWIAIYMLFEKVPFLYGSGVIPERFEEFKAGIKHLIVQEFFTREHIERFFEAQGVTSAEALNDRIDFDVVFGHLVDAIVESPMGGMLNMLGGRSALDPLKGPVIQKLQGVISELASGKGSENGGDLTAGLVRQVEHIIDSRLAELTPHRVKTIIEEMIRRHLGWLVVWGGVFGGLIGLVAAIFSR
jgi:uncharacterized membrane-anchored protein YjiN (DUF445 family)